MFIVLMALIVYLIIKPFIVLILSGAVLAYVFYPLYLYTKKFLRKETISALVVSVVILILIIIPSLFVVVSVGDQTENFYQSMKERVDGEGIGICTGGENTFCSVFNFLNDPEVKQYFSIEEIVGKASTSLVNWVTDFLLGIPSMLLDFIIVIFVMFYFFKDGRRLEEYLKRKINLKKKKTEVIIEKIKNVVDSIVFGNLVMAAIQGTLGTIGFWILGISNPLLWGILMAFFSLIPFIGTAAIWLPASIILLFNGMWIKAIILVAYGFVIIGGTDTVVKPILIGDKSKIHPIIILVGVLGGLSLFGMMGIILGPLILGIATTLFTTFVGDRK